MFDDNKYYVFGSGWEGMTLKDIKYTEPEAICDTYEEAMNEVDRLWDEILAPDEGAYVYHNGRFVYEE